MELRQREVNCLLLQPLCCQFQTAHISSLAWTAALYWAVRAFNEESFSLGEYVHHHDQLTPRVSDSFVLKMKPFTLVVSEFAYFYFFLIVRIS